MKKIYRSNRKHMRGVSTVGIAITIMVSIIVLMGSVSGYYYLQQAKINNEVQLLTRLKQNTVRYGQVVGTFTSSNVTLATLGTMGFFDDSLLTTTETGGVVTGVTNQWGGAVTVAIVDVFTTGDSIQFINQLVPSSVCADLGSRLDSIAIRVGVENTRTKESTGTSDLSKLQTACNSKSAVRMTFTLLR